jgi:hypothetical protein
MRRLGLGRSGPGFLNAVDLDDKPARMTALTATRSLVKNTERFTSTVVLSGSGSVTVAFLALLSRARSASGSGRLREPAV